MDRIIYGACAKRRGHNGRTRRSLFRVGTAPSRIYANTPTRPKPPKRSYSEQKQAEARLRGLQRGLPAPVTSLGSLARRRRKPLPAFIVYAPADLSFDANRDEMLGFIRAYHWHTYAPGGADGVGTVVADLAHVQRINLDAALVLVAEYHRAVLGRDGYRPPIDDAKWPRWVQLLLEELGFYTLVDASDRTADAGEPDLTFDLKFVPFISGFEVEGEAADVLIKALAAAAGRTTRRFATYNALVEAMKNVKIHAYPDEALPSLVPVAHRWWAAGAYSPADQTLEFSMYDQGVGIPATLPRRDIWQAVKEWCPPEFNDADVIQGAIELGRSASGLRERGNGLWTICRLVDELPGSQVRILSGRGELIYAGSDNMEKKLHDNPFCGTLIQWSLNLQSDVEAGVAP